MYIIRQLTAGPLKVDDFVYMVSNTCAGANPNIHGELVHVKIYCAALVLSTCFYC